MDAALEYLDLGFSVVPVKRADKKPYVKWEKYQHEHPTVDDVEKWWNMWPDANVAIVTGDISEIWVMDADGPAGVEWINANAPKTGVYSITSKGVHAIFKIPEGVSIANAVRLFPEIDVRGNGGYVVVPPSIHADGHTYLWRFLLDGWEDLAEWKPPVNGNGAVQSNGNGNGKGNLNVDLTGVKEAPVRIPVAKGERNNALARLAGQWIGMGLDDDEVEVLARSWNETNLPPLDEKELLTTLASIRKTHTRKHPEPPSDVEVDTSLKRQKIVEKIPDEILHPGGTLEEIMQYININSTVAVPIFSMASVVTFLGNVIGQKFMTETGLRTNIYSICLGYSGAGKNSPFCCLPQLLHRTRAAETSGPTELTSSTAILRWLSQDNRNVSMMMLDEIGMVMQGLKQPRSPGAEIPRLLTKLFSATNREEIKNYADGSEIIVKWHHLSLYGASTPDRFWQSLTPGEILDGFLARVLIWESHIDAPIPKDIIVFQEAPHLENKINALADIPFDMDTSKLQWARPVPRTIARENSIRSEFKDWSDHYHGLKNLFKNDQTGVGPVYGRAAEHAGKLALIHAVSMQGPKIKSVPAESVHWAMRVVEYLINNTVIQIQENVAENDVVRWRQRIAKGIRDIEDKTRTPGVTFRDLSRGPCRGLLKRDALNILESMIAAGEIVAEENKPHTGRPTLKYFLSKELVQDNYVTLCHKEL